LLHFKGIEGKLKGKVNQSITTIERKEGKVAAERERNVG
jgi:hypothetical protein